MTDDQMLQALELLLSDELPDQLCMDLFTPSWPVSKDGQLLLFE